MPVPVPVHQRPLNHVRRARHIRLAVLRERDRRHIAQRIRSGRGERRRAVRRIAAHRRRRGVVKCRGVQPRGSWPSRIASRTHPHSSGTSRCHLRPMTGRSRRTSCRASTLAPAGLVKPVSPIVTDSVLLLRGGVTDADVVRLQDGRPVGARAVGRAGRDHRGEVADRPREGDLPHRRRFVSPGPLSSTTVTAPPRQTSRASSRTPHGRNSPVPRPRWPPRGRRRWKVICSYVTLS